MNLPKLKIQASRDVASKALDCPAFPMALIEGTKNYRPETRIPCKELMILSDAALSASIIHDALAQDQKGMPPLPTQWRQFLTRTLLPAANKNGEPRANDPGRNP